jgi:hypothetical protein
VKLKPHRNVQVTFRVSSKWLQIVQMLAKLEGRAASTVMRELLTLGLAQYVNIYYRTPQLVREQELKSKFSNRLKTAAAEATAQRRRRGVYNICYTPSKKQERSSIIYSGLGSINIEAL